MVEIPARENDMLQKKETNSALKMIPPPPPPQISLPILIGLFRRDMCPSSILREAMHQFRSSLVLSRWLLSLICHKTQAVLYSNSYLDIADANLYWHNPHWIFRCLFSPSIRVRGKACQIIIDGLRSLSQPTQIASSPRDPSIELFHIIQYCLDATMQLSNSSLCSGLISNPEGGDPVIQLFGLFAFLICGWTADEEDRKKKSIESGKNLKELGVSSKKRKRALTAPTKVSVSIGKGDNKQPSTKLLSTTLSSQKLIKSSGSTRSKNVDQQCNSTGPGKRKAKKKECKLKEEASTVSIDEYTSSATMKKRNFPNLIEYFGANGGVRWAARSALCLMSALIQTSSSSVQIRNDSFFFSEETLNESSYDAIFTRLALLIDLSHRVLIRTNKTQTQNAKKGVYSILWKSNLTALTVQDVSLSPLACFICLHEVLKTACIGSLGNNFITTSNAIQKWVDKSIINLSQIVDPSMNFDAVKPFDSTSVARNTSHLSKSNPYSLLYMEAGNNKKRKLQRCSLGARPSTSTSQSFSQAPTTSGPLSLTFGRSNDRSAAAVAAAVNVAMSEIDMIDEEINSDEDDEEDENHDECVLDNSDHEAGEDDDEVEEGLDGLMIDEDEDDEGHNDDDEDDEEDEKVSDEEEQSDDEDNGVVDDLVSQSLIESASASEEKSNSMRIQILNLEDDEGRGGNANKLIHSGRDSQSSSASNMQIFHEKLRQNESAPLTCNENSSKCVPSILDRKKAYIQAAMQILVSQHSALNASKSSVSIKKKNIAKPLLSPPSERSLIKSICDIVKPPPKPLNLKIFMRRAPSQEEYFRGNLSKNPISLAHLANVTSANASSNGTKEPTFKDLRKHIADDLHMSDSAELLELLVAGKIVSMSLKVRVAQQVLWRKHILENSCELASSSGFLNETDMSSLPAMIVTYRLAGVDGEATEDKVEENDLVDPLAPKEKNNGDDKEFAITEIITRSNGVSILLKSIEMDIGDMLRRVRRDEIGNKKMRRKSSGMVRLEMMSTSVGPGLMLLRYCAHLKLNRKIMVQARAPSRLLRLLLDVLNAMEKNSVDSFGKSSNNGVATTASSIPMNSGSNESASSLSLQEGNNPTANSLQELIELLASDISSNSDYEETSKSIINEEESDDVTLPLLLKSMKETNLSPRFRLVISKLLPFLTYGLPSLSLSLASQIIEHVSLEFLENMENSASSLMMTFVDSVRNLPSVEVCNGLRVELLRQGFVKHVVNFVMAKSPSKPPSWSPTLHHKNERMNDVKNIQNEDWKAYFQRQGLQISFEVLIGLCNQHQPTQTCIAEIPNFLILCHWLENISETMAGFELNGVGLLAETLLDKLKEKNDAVQKKVRTLRNETRKRKKEIAEERRTRALVGISCFASIDKNPSKFVKPTSNKDLNDQPNSLPENIIDVNGEQISSDQSLGAGNNKVNVVPPKKKQKRTAILSQPSWLAEMEALEDEGGAICAVCQEGIKSQPSQLLGLYAFVKKVSIAQNKGGVKTSIDGTHLFLGLPATLPDPLLGTEIGDRFFFPAKNAAKNLSSIPSSGCNTTQIMSSSSLLSSRPSYFITTVTAGTAIHYCCHAKARQVDRNHPKAPKSEWEGASLRNSRVSCNVMLPLIPSKANPNLPLVALDTGLADFQAVIANMLGGRPKSMLWTVLHDIRLLLLRISYDEKLNADCGGGSLTSNIELIFYLFSMAQIFIKHADHDAPGTAQHARCLSLAFISACEILKVKDIPNLHRPTAEAAPMAGICAILFHNGIEIDDNTSSLLFEKRQFHVYKHHFLNGMLQCAGRRKACGIEDSGCVSSRGVGGKRPRSFSLGEVDSGENKKNETATNKDEVEMNAESLKPMLIFYTLLDQLSLNYVPDMDDEKVSSSSEMIAQEITKYHQKKSVDELVKELGIKKKCNQIHDEFEKGKKSQ